MRRYFDHRVDGRERRRGQLDPERLDGLEIHDQLELDCTTGRSDCFSPLRMHPNRVRQRTNKQKSRGGLSEFRTDVFDQTGEQIGQSSITSRCVCLNVTFSGYRKEFSGTGT
jgi:hypothetical protein